MVRRMNEEMLQNKRRSIKALKEMIGDLKGEEVVIRYGKGKRRRREVHGSIGDTFKRVFTLEYEKEGHKLREAFRYDDLRMENFSMVLEKNGATVTPELSSA